MLKKNLNLFSVFLWIWWSLISSFNGSGWRLINSVRFTSEHSVITARKWMTFKQESSGQKLHCNVVYFVTASLTRLWEPNSHFHLQFHSRQPDESGHHAFHWEPWCAHHSPQPLPQLPPPFSQHARLQLGEHRHHWSCYGPPTTDPRGAARHWRGGRARPDSGISWSLQRQRGILHWGKTRQEDKKRTNRLT